MARARLSLCVREHALLPEVIIASAQPPQSDFDLKILPADAIALRRNYASTATGSTATDTRQRSRTRRSTRMHATVSPTIPFVDAAPGTRCGTDPPTTPDEANPVDVAREAERIVSERPRPPWLRVESPDVIHHGTTTTRGTQTQPLHDIHIKPESVYRTPPAAQRQSVAVRPGGPISTVWWIEEGMRPEDLVRPGLVFMRGDRPLLPHQQVEEGDTLSINQDFAMITIAGEHRVATLKQMRVRMQRGCGRTL